MDKCRRFVDNFLLRLSRHHSSVNIANYKKVYIIVFLAQRRQDSRLPGYTSDQGLKGCFDSLQLIKVFL